MKTADQINELFRVFSLTMRQYVYRDYFTCAVVFTCTACNIAEADKAFQAVIGKHPASLPHIGCNNT